MDQVISIPSQNLSTIILQPYDGTWRMGEDYPLQISIDITIITLMEQIEKIKGISSHRQQIRLSNHKLIPKNREIWALRRHGIQNNTRIKIEPTRPGGWIWNDIEYYIEKLLGEIIDILLPLKLPILMTELEKQIFYPPCFDYSFRVFLRNHPDRLRLRTDIGSGNIWIQLTNGIQLPSFERIPLNVGYITRYNPEEFAWEDYSDVDSMRPLESQITLPDVMYDISINCGKYFGYYGHISTTNPFVVILKDGKYIGHSPVKVASRGPIWDRVRFQLGFQFGCYLGDFTVSFEVWNMKITSPNTSNQLISLQKIQYIDITGRELSLLLQPIDSNVFRDYYLENYIQEEIRQKEDEILLRNANLLIEEQERGRNREMGDVEVTPIKEEVVQNNGDVVEEGEGGAEKGEEVEEMDPFLRKKLFPDEASATSEPHQSLASGSQENLTNLSNPQTTLTTLITTSSHGLLTLMGSKSIYQIKIRSAYELFSHETQLSEEIQPMVVILWNGIDIGQTSAKQHTRWACWYDAIFNIAVPGNMEPGQCSLEFQVWNLDEIGAGKRLMSKALMTGRFLRELLTKNSPYCSHETIELQLPPPIDEIQGDEKQHFQAKKKDKSNKNKSNLSGGYLAIVGGLVGLQEKTIRLYEIQLLVGTGMARQEVECIIYWNSIEIGQTDSATIRTEQINKTTTVTKWIWKKNKFIFSLYDNDVISKSELKIDCWDPTTKGTNSYIGCAILSTDELVSFIDQPYLVQQAITLKKDPKKEDKRVTKGTLTIRGGRYGSRLETERLFEIKGLEFPEMSQELKEDEEKEKEKEEKKDHRDEKSVGGLSHYSHRSQQSHPHRLDPIHQDDPNLPPATDQMISSSLSSCYCVIYWNDDCIGSTNSLLHDGYPVWELFDQKWFYLPDVPVNQPLTEPPPPGGKSIPQGSSLYYTNGTLLIEVWEGNGNNVSEEEKRTHKYLGGILLNGHSLEDFMESTIPVTLTLQLTNYKRSSATQVKGKKGKGPIQQEIIEKIPAFILLSTPGKVDYTPFQEIERQEKMYSELLENEIEKRGVQTIFERKKKVM